MLKKFGPSHDDADDNEINSSDYLNIGLTW